MEFVIKQADFRKAVKNVIPAISNGMNVLPGVQLHPNQCAQGGHHSGGHRRKSDAQDGDPG